MRKHNKGIALIAILITIMVLTVLGAATITRSVTENNISKRYLRSTQAFWAAEAGIQQALYAVNQGLVSNWPVNAAGNRVSSGSLNAGGTALNYLITVSNLGTGNPVTITVTGSNGNITRTVEARLTQGGTSSPFTYAAFGLNSVSMSGNGRVNSYDSSMGAYTSGSAGSNGDVGTNSGASGAITLSGNAKIYGDAGTGSTGTVTLNGNAQVNGDITQDINETFALPVVPGELSSRVSEGAYTASGNTNTSLSGEHRYTSLNISGNAKVTLSGTVKLYLTSSSSLSVTGNAKIIIPSGAKLLVYTDGTCNIAGNGFVNQANLPENTQIYSTYTGANGINFSGNSNLHAAIYAPGTNIAASGNADIFGSIIGKTVTVSGNGNIHYDEALQNLGGTSSASYSLDAWRDQASPYLLQ